jgi:hypothetical protein
LAYKCSGDANVIRLVGKNMTISWMSRIPEIQRSCGAFPITLSGWRSNQL